MRESFGLKVPIRIFFNKKSSRPFVRKTRR
jgi:hypothetical protein